MPPKQIEKGKERLQIQGPTTPQITTPPHTQIQITTPRSTHRPRARSERYFNCQSYFCEND